MPTLVDELLSAPIPEKLWHYTSIQGFHGIVKSKSIFATDLRFLNDREEFVHTRALADGIASKLPDLDDNGLPYKKLIDNAVKLAFQSGPLVTLQVFVASFTAAEDQLGQWRGYSHGSSGVSIAFGLKALRPPPGADTLVAFAPCVYAQAQKEEILLNALRHVRDEVGGYYDRVFRVACENHPEKLPLSKEDVVLEFLQQNPSKKAPKDQFEAAVTKTRVDCLRVAALLKNASFEEEREWRLVLPIDKPPQALKNPPQFRAGRTTLIPYISHPLASGELLPIVDVILGPGSDENSVLAATKFLQSEGYEVAPKLSKVPYRAA